MIQKRLSKTTKKGCLSRDPYCNLTKSEKEVLGLLTKKFFTKKQIMQKKGCTKQNVDKIVRNLRKKGLLGLGNTEVVDFEPTTHFRQPNRQLPNEMKGCIRLHAQEFNIKLLSHGGDYERLRGKCNVLLIDKNTIRLYRDSIEVYSGRDFNSESVRQATVMSFNYWNRFFTRLQHDLKVVLLKSRYQNIKLVNQHYSEIGNELAGEAVEKSYKIRVYATDDNKLWFSCDNSFNLKEAETLHPETAEKDMGEVVKPFFNDLRDSKPPLQSELTRLMIDTQKQIQQLVQCQLNTNGQLQGTIELIKPSNKLSEELDVDGERFRYIG